MQPLPKKSTTLATGLAMFSMLFGAGNIVFPLALGQHAQSQNFFAILGLLITAVGVPFLGLLAMTLFDGDYKKFFNRIGKVPGFLISAIILGLIGPFGAIPRCIALSYSTIQVYLPNISLELFSIISCIVIFFLTVRRNRIVDILGYVLTPILLISLAIIVVKGMLMAPSMPMAEHPSLAIFIKGLKEGYQTMDLLAAFFFCSVVLACLKEEEEEPPGPGKTKKLMLQTLKASCIGAGLLAAIYIGFSYLAAHYSVNLGEISSDLLISKIAIQVLGNYAGIVACISVSLACLTTAIALSAVFAEFLHEDISLSRINYPLSLIVTLITAFLVSTLNFTGIAAFLQPVLRILYPALIVLSIMNILNRLYHVRTVKTPFWITLALSIVLYVYSLNSFS